MSKKNYLPLPWSMVHRLWSKFMVYGLWSMVFFSCTTQKQLTYLQDIDEAGSENFFPLVRQDYRLQQQDILYVKFSTINDDINNVLNAGTTQGNQSMILSESGAYLSGYIINDSGLIKLPIIGEVAVLGKTLEEATQSIEEKAKKYLREATVIVKLFSFKFTVLGEVNAPGTYRNYTPQLSVFEALGMAGDITEYGNRSNVLLLRSSKDGTQTYRINLQEKGLLSLNKYYILPNDVIIVEPIKPKLIQINAPSVSYILSFFTTTITILLFIISINN